MYTGLIFAALLWGIQHVDLAHWTYCFLYVQTQFLRIQQYRQRRERERMERIRDFLMEDPKFVASLTDRANRVVNLRMRNAEIARLRTDRRLRRKLGILSPFTPTPRTTVGERLTRGLLKIN